MDIHIPPSIFIIIGLCCNIVGAILISLEAFGLREFITRLHDKSTYEHHAVLIGYQGLTNQFFEFVLINCLWVIVLICFVGLPAGFAILLFPLGYIVWWSVTKILESSRDYMQRLLPKRGKEHSCVGLLTILPVLVLWTIISLLFLVVRYVLVLPLTFFSQEVIGRGLLILFKSVKKTLDKSELSHLKVPSLLGAVFLIFGFAYQIVGVVLMMLA